MKFKKFLSLFMVCVMGAGAFAACAPETSDDAQKITSDEHATVRGELQVLQSDYQMPAEDRLARIKAEYLIENKGYRDGDDVVAILSLNGDALIDSYLENEELSAKDSLAEYVASPMGQQKKESIAFEQTDLIRRLWSEGLIKSVNYRYTTVANAVAVTMTYGNFLALEDLGYCKSVALAETYTRPLEAEGTDASTIVNDVDVYEHTGIFDSSSALDPDGHPYTGKHTSVAILDSGFDLSHQVFNTHTLDDEDELMFKRSDIAQKLASADMNAENTTAGLAITDVFYSNKIPYKYDYADKDSDVFPFDSEHGTHVAGIIGGFANEFTDKDKNTVIDDETGKPEKFTGIAIDTQLVLMKVFSDFNEGAETDDILAALEDAVVLGVDAINMSLGAACGFTREKDGDVVNEVYDKINESGTSLITAAGNEYSSGFGGAQGNTNFVTNPDSGTIGSPASYPAALSVASISGVKSKYLVGNNEQVVFFHESNSIAGEENDFFSELYTVKGWAKDSTPHTVEYVTVPGYGSRANYTTIDVRNKIALVSRGDTTFEEKALQAKNAGALACIIYNNIEGDILMSMGKSDHIPTISISKEDGVKLASQRTGTFTLSYDQQAGPFMSDFSCWGPLPDLTLKPEITAHGGNITSSAPGGSFITISGTSMACPNLCGVVVLIRQYIKDNYERLTGKTTPETGDNDSEYMKNIKNLTNTLLMSTAGIVLNEHGNPYSPRKQGAGLASLYNAVNTKAYIVAEKKVDGELTAVDRPKLELGDDKNRTGIYEMYLDVVSIADEPVSYDVGVIGMTESVSTADEDFVAERDQLLSGSVKVALVGESSAGSVNGTTVTVNAKQTLKLKVTYTLSQKDKDLIDNSFPYGMYVEGFVTLAIQEEATEDYKPVDLNVPFLAYYGDWTQAPIFDKTYYEVETEAHNAGIDEEDKIKADYYATTPYGSYWYNYIIPLGTYLYNMDESVYDPIPATEDRIAISDTLNTIDGIAAVYAGLLRSCKTMTYTITDKATGETVYTKEVTNARKAFSQGGSPIPNYQALGISTAELGLLNNREYEFEMIGELDYGDGGASANARNSFSFSFTVDTQAPIIKSASYEKVYDKTLKKDRYYLNLTVYDNAYAMSVTPGIMTQNPDYNGNLNETSPIQFTSLSADAFPLYGEKGGEATVRFEITDYLPELKNSIYVNAQTGSSWSLAGTLCIMLDDYALNQNLFLCALPGTSGAFKFTEDGTENGRVKSSVNIGINEVKDLTQFLYTADSTVDENKDYLKYLTWESRNPDIAVVENGQVRGLKAGTARITVTEPLMSRSAQITVGVVKKSTTATAATISSDDRGVSLLTADDVQDATQARITDIRFSNFTTIFAHASAGQVSEIGSTGEKTILTAYQGGIAMYPGEIIQLEYAVTPWYVKDNYTYTYKSDRTDVLTVDENGVVRALKKGSATVTLSVSGSNLIARLRVTVNSEFVIDEARTLVAYKGLGGYVEIPDDEGILYIGPHCFGLYETNNRYAQELPEDDIYANRIPKTNSSITTVVVPKGVTDIQQNAFSGCTKLEKVVLPDTVRFIRKNAFLGDTQLHDINLENVEAIAADAFSGCTALQTVNLSKCYSIGERAFKGAGLTSLDVTHLRNAGNEAFMNCKSLASVTFDDSGLTKLSEHIFDGCALTSVTCYESNVIPAYAFANNKLTSVTLASQKGIALIDDNAFANNPDLEELTLPNGAFSLGGNVFAGCAKLATVKLQTNSEITAAQGAAFNESGLTRFALADGTTQNANYTISADGKQLVKDTEIVLAAVKAYDGTLSIPANITHIRESAFAGAGITELILLGNTSIGQYAFANCAALTKVTLAEAGNDIGNYAFYQCATLGTVENLDKATRIGDYAFAAADPTKAKTALTSATLGANVTVGANAFAGSGLQTLTLGAGDNLGAYAFYLCEALTTVNMPDDGGVKIGTACFSGDARLATIDLTKATGALGEEAFFGCSDLAAADLSNITKIGALAFANCKKLASVTLGTETAEIGMGAFMDYTYFTRGSGTEGPIFASIDLSHVTSIGEMAFFGCTKLASATLPVGLTELSDNAFAYCTSLKTVNLGNVTSVGNFAFAGCTALDSIDLSKVTHIGAGAFYRTTKLTNANLAAAVKIESLAFADSGLTTVSAPVLQELPTTVLDRNVVLLSLSEINLDELWIDLPDDREEAETDLGDFVFTGSYAFRGAKFAAFDASKLAVIGDGAFNGNTALTTFKFYNTLTHVGAGAFYGCSNLASFTTDGQNGKINDYAHLTDGVLYTTLKNGKQQLSAVPAALALTGGTLTVEEGTSRVDDFAGNANTKVTSIILPDALETIGEYAFYGYTALTSVEFRSVTAPKLENSYDESVSLSESAPGYGILHDQFGMYGEEMTYYNFIDLVGRRYPITMVLPKNSDVSGYDSIVYRVYFGEVADARRSDYTAMEQSMKDFLWYGREVKAIENIMLTDEALVSKAVIALNGVKQDPTAYGISTDEWNELSTAVTAARDRILRLKVEYAAKNIRDIQARIDALPDSYSDTEALNSTILALQEAIGNLETDDRNLLIQTKYTRLLDAYNAAHPANPDTPSNPTDPSNPETPDEGTGEADNGCGSVIGIGGGAIALVILLGAAIILLRKKEN